MSGKFIDAYSVLQIAPEADEAAVRARHRELAKQFHPDRGGRAADGELMMRINRARDVLLDPVARATLDEELARRRRESAQETAGNGTTTPPPSPDRRWRAEWGSGASWTAPASGGGASGPVPPPGAARVRPSANRLRHATRMARGVSPALSARLRPTASAQPGAAQPGAAQPGIGQAGPQAPLQPTPQPNLQPGPEPMAASSPNLPPQGPQLTAPVAEPANSWSLYSAPLDVVSVASLVTSLLMFSPIAFILGIVGLARTADDKRRGRWAAVAGIALSTLTMLVVIGYVMQAVSAAGP